jgi:hypothetical protein
MMGGEEARRKRQEESRRRGQEESRAGQGRRGSKE